MDQAQLIARYRVTGIKAITILGTGLGQRKPTAIQSGNRQAALLGERSRRKQPRTNRLLIASLLVLS